MPNHTILWDKWAVAGLKRLVGGPYANRLRRARAAVATKLNFQIAEYDHFCTEWRREQNTYDAVLTAGCLAIQGSNLTHRIAAYWVLNPADVDRWCGEQWFKWRVFDAVLHIVGNRWSTLAGVNLDLADLNL